MAKTHSFADTGPNSEAVRTQSPSVDVGDSLTAFVKRLRLDTGGRTIQTIKSQVGMLSAALIRMARMNKRQQMRWTPTGAHRVLQVRAAVLDGRCGFGQQPIQLAA